MRAGAWAGLVPATLAGAIVVGSRTLQHFDAALVGYTFATLFAAFGIASSVSHSSDFRVQKSREMGPVSKTVPNSSWTHSVPRAGLLEFLRVLGDEVSKPIGTCAKCLAQALYPFRASPWRIQREACARSVQSGGCV